MRAMTLSSVAIVLAMATGGCGGSASTLSNPPTVGTVALSCQAAMPFAGPSPRVAVPGNLFPTATGGAATDRPLPESLTAMLNLRVRELLNTSGAPAISAAITIPGFGRWSSTQGLAQTQPAQTVGDATEFYWGSIAKMLTAVVVLQLVEEGKLHMDDRLARWFPQIPKAELITIAQLLSHTSGLQTNVHGSTGLAAETPAQQVQLLSNQALLFCPGTDASYSNAAYLLLALVVEALEQQPMHQSVQRRIAAPLGLQHLRALRPGEDAPIALAMPHAGQTPTADPGAWTRLGAGNVVGRAEDLVVFWQAVLSGRLLAPTTVQSQWTVLHALGPQTREAGQGIQWFGRGVMLTEWTDGVGRTRTWLGHFGGIPTANATVLYDHVANAYAAIAVNSDVSTAAVANALLNTVLDWRALH